ncbi:thiamine pyrophosphate-binding protein, partial [Staphylococcus warneri]|uniref:thiamine pyrophosphate-binding protein n=1 Tax=Staphylococcus warneri TaxID=1292 RepID=UPI0021B21416
DECKLYHVSQEEVGSLGGGSYRKMRGKIGVGLSIGGAGLVELLNGMYEGKMDRVAELIICGETKDSVLGRGGFEETKLCKLCEDVGV